MPRHFDYLLLGGGTSCGYAAASIRERDKEGTIGIISADKEPPYDRPPFSKNFLTNDAMEPSDAHSKDESFYPNNDVELILQSEAHGLDIPGKIVRLVSGEEIVFGKLLYALGSEPRMPKLAGAENLHLLRTVSDSEKIRDAARTAKSAVIVGGGFIGVEVGASLLKRGLSVSLVEMGDRLYSSLPSPAVSAIILRELETMGGKVYFGESAESVSDSKLKTKSGKELEGELMVAGIGAAPRISLAERAGLKVEKGVLADSGLRAADAVWVAGDDAEYPDAILGRPFRAEHHMHAKWTGQHCGTAMAGDPSEYRKVPYFYSDIGELSLIFRGDPSAAGTTHRFGNEADPMHTEIVVRPDGSVASMMDIRRDYKAQDPLNDLFEALIEKRVNVAARIIEPNLDLLTLKDLV